jgi:chromosome segregation ATPase
LRGGGGGGARSGPSIRHNNNRAVRQPIKVAAGVGSGEDGVGLNELKGAVLLDAEDYRKMVQEVKTLKTMLLRLKRELAADGGVSPSNSVTSTVSMSSMARLKRLGGSNNGELLDKIQKLTSERDKAIHEVEEMKKSKVKEEKKYEGLKEEMEQMKNEREKLTCKVNELEQHREYLIDKMERLHADKHKVEDKLNTIEKSSLYERTILEEHMMISDDDDITLYDDHGDGGGNDNLLCYDDEEATY